MVGKTGIIVVTGIMASGKSTVSQLLAERFERGVHVRGDVFRRMVVSGRAEMSPDPSEEAMRQLRLRYRLAAATAEAYCEAGFQVVVQDNYIGQALGEFVDMIRHRPLYVVALCPSPEIVAGREAGRAKTGYGAFSVESFYRLFHEETPKIGLWLDNSEQTPEETVSEILARVEAEGRI
jgi:chloramphenicol 3-O-phosphotransferase